MTHWELGSFFQKDDSSGTPQYPWQSQAQHEQISHEYWSSGRAALSSLLSLLVEQHGTKRVLLPSYYCPDVVDYLDLPIHVDQYRCDPLRPPRSVVGTPNDAVVVSSFIGRSQLPTVVGGALTIEDRTHSLLEEPQSSTSDYYFASLRKTLPLPDGGVVWTRRQTTLPVAPPPSENHADLTERVLMAMDMKDRYLKGQGPPKELFLNLAAAAEREFGRTRPSGIAGYTRERLATLPTLAYQRQRASNGRLLRTHLASTTIAGYLVPSPFNPTLILPSHAVRERVRLQLKERNIYAVVLWDLNRTGDRGPLTAEQQLSQRVLTLPCDHRYGDDDMRILADVLKEVEL